MTTSGKRENVRHYNFSHDLLLSKPVFWVQELHQRRWRLLILVIDVCAFRVPGSMYDDWYVA